MLGVRLKPQDEERLARYARDAGRSKSTIVREWIVDQLERRDVDELIRRAARLHAEAFTAAEGQRARALSDAHLRDLDIEDGGYDWGPEGPPPVR